MGEELRGGKEKKEACSLSRDLRPNIPVASLKNKTQQTPRQSLYSLFKFCNRLLLAVSSQLYLIFVNLNFRVKWHTKVNN